MKIHYKGFSEEADEWRDYENENNMRTRKPLDTASMVI